MRGEKNGGKVWKGGGYKMKSPPPSTKKNTKPPKDESIGKSLKTVEALIIKEDCRKGRKQTIEEVFRILNSSH